MAYNEQLVTRIRKAFSHVRNVEEKRMFGGLAFLVDKKMCISVIRERIMCRIDPTIHEDVIKMPGCETVTMGSREYKGYVYVNEDSIIAKKDFEYWICLCLDFNKTAKS